MQSSNLTMRSGCATLVVLLLLRINRSKTLSYPWQTLTRCRSHSPVDPSATYVVPPLDENSFRTAASSKFAAGPLSTRTMGLKAVVDPPLFPDVGYRNRISSTSTPD
ncbi:hypothetical protein BGZ61DRAFT_27508 [Ilyonectria robusta]|uniref:uncharacterized protein n=1 Tax=Ilyonectria robusta TaxID=1079257 RepID=UPI001E8DB804|nr:uncharacterized protein BGZ61DRAFT_27508 [Ilyonectria robusta]KAH8738074.1 hypothetical protein BGZ61DRAFT_27508 [Ilyonectria robusta]